jgi:endonuclease/exonuclease/phosphatase family metal-dependent hydrolase
MEAPRFHLRYHRRMFALRRIVFVGLIAISGNCATQDASPSPAPQIVRAAFWNIQWFPGRHPFATASSERAQTASVHRDMRKMNVDVLGMEEVRDFSKATIAVESLAGMKVDVVSNFPPREGQDVGQQVAIASRFQPLSAWIEMWKANGALVPPRGFAFAAYEVAPRHLLLVYAVHLKSNRGEVSEDIAIREESVRQLMAHMRAMNEAYGKMGTVSCLVGGDFNTAPDDSRFAGEKTTQLLRDNGFLWSWQDVPFARRITMPADKLFPAASFDHIFVRNGKFSSARVIDMSRGSSDHNAIFAEVQL